VAVVGTGPAGLMAATALSDAGVPVVLFEKRPGAGRKILVAGSSGLNVSFDSPLDEFVKNYRDSHDRCAALLRRFPPEAWVAFIQSLGLETFKGTSGRFFVKDMKGATLLRAWTDRLKAKGAEFRLGQECTGFSAESSGIRLEFGDQRESFSAACFALGGGSWEKSGKPVSWPALFTAKGIRVLPFQSANSGFRVDWPPGFIAEAEGLPLKNIVLKTQKGVRVGELSVTSYGLEGTPVYAIGEPGEAWLDLKPDLSLEDIRAKLAPTRENFAPIRLIKKNLRLSPAALALVFHLTPKSILDDRDALEARVKNFPIRLGERQPLDEAISSSGGLSWDEVDDALMLKRIPGVFIAGEMLDWDAPTGGYLIQGCVSQGFAAGAAAAARVLAR